VLTAQHAGITDAAPVYYRQLQVGRVLHSTLNPAASGVEIEILIEPQHAALVNSNSVFWDASGVQMDLDLSDPKIEIESLKALLAGGVAFATPESSGARAADGSQFQLHDKPKLVPGAARRRQYWLRVGQAAPAGEPLDCAMTRGVLTAVRAAVKAGAMDVVEKPYRDEKLFDSIENALQADAVAHA
jgi:hypothetical protein